MFKKEIMFKKAKYPIIKKIIFINENSQTIIKKI